MFRSHKIRLYPNNKQANYFKRACGTARFAFNWALAKWKDMLYAGAPVSESSLRRSLNGIKRDEFPWMFEVTKCAPQMAIKNDLNNAFKNYFAGRAGFPRFHKKGDHDSFSVSNDQFEVKGKYVRIPKNGWTKMAEKLRFDGKIIGAAISRKADKWFISIQVEIPDPKPAPARENQAVGVDLGVKAFASLSDGTIIPGAPTWGRYEKKVRRLGHELSRRKGAKKGEGKSKNFQKTKIKLARAYSKMADIRNDGTHKLTALLANNYDLIGIEDLNVSGMIRNHKLAKAIADRSFFEFRRQLEYKSIPVGTTIIAADRFFASSKICNLCGIKNESLDLSDRDWTCHECGTEHDRDINAAINLKNYAINISRINAASYTASACGEFRISHSVKQEINIKS